MPGRDVGQVQRRAPEAADLELGEHGVRRGDEGLVERTVEPDQGLRARLRASRRETAAIAVGQRRSPARRA